MSKNFKLVRGNHYKRHCGKYYAVITDILRGGRKIVYNRYYVKNDERYRSDCSLSAKKFRRKYPEPMSGYHKHKSELDV